MKIKLLLFLVMILVSYLLIRVFDKVKLKSISIFLNNITENLNFIYIKSNHKDRVIFFRQSLKNKILFSNLNYSKDRSNIMFIGDSHVEHYSRSNINNSIKQYSSALWLGPCTVLGNYFQQNSSNLLKKIIKISDLKNNYKIKYIAFSFGSIDIRTIFYQLLIAKTVIDENDLFKKFEIGIQYLIDTLIKPLNVNNNRVLGIVELFNSPLIGTLPNSIKEINIIKSKDPYPTFGTIKQRDK